MHQLLAAPATWACPHFLVGLVPCLPVSRSLLRSSTTASLLAPSVAPSLGRVSLDSSCCPPAPHSLRHHQRLMRGEPLRSCASSSRHLTMNRSAASRTPRCPFPPFSLLQWATARFQHQRSWGRVPLILRWLGNPYGFRLCAYVESYFVCQVSGSTRQPSSRPLPD